MSHEILDPPVINESWVTVAAGANRIGCVGASTKAKIVIDVVVDKSSDWDSDEAVRQGAGTKLLVDSGGITYVDAGHAST